MTKKITILLVILMLLLSGCSKPNDNVINNEENNNQITNTEDNKTGDIYSDTAVIILDETEEKITEEFNIDGIGNIKFTHSTTSSKESLVNGKIAKGDVLCIGDFQYVFMKKFDGEKYVDYDVTGFSIKAISQKAKYDMCYTTLFRGIVFNADYCFYKNELLNSIPDLPSSIISAKHCFDGCKNLKTDDLGTYLHNISNLTDTDYMFANCENIIDVSLSEDVITNAIGMFYNCKNLTNFYAIPKSIKNANNMFENCPNLSGCIVFSSQPEKYTDIFKGTSKEIIVLGINDEIFKEYDNIKKGD